MAIARAPWRPLVPCLESLAARIPRSVAPMASAPPRRRYHAAPTGPKRNTKGYNPKPVKRLLSEEIRRFVKPDGRLLTNQVTRDFLVEHDIEPDHGRMTWLSAGPELSRVGSDFTARLAYSPKHVLHPHDLRFFDPRGCPVAAKKRADYARKKQEKPLWIFTTSLAGVSAVVRHRTQQKLTRSVYEALGELGHPTTVTTPGDRARVEVWGTLWITLLDPLRAAGHCPERFGRVVADALVATCSRQRG
ncbi:hypothetical protein E4U41_003405 [Claviceps citrina]|nr:hypothetical protein E4U41_003405 [Claviceps citrina]